jgi:DNA-binding MarR family transcriptional regulator
MRSSAPEATLDRERRPGQRPLLPLLYLAADAFAGEFHRRLESEGFGDIRPGHGCVFGNIEPEGTRLTELAARAECTKQAVGEAVTDLERLGYVERIPDPSDRRAKIVRLSELGREAQGLGLRLLAEVERDWAERFGEEAVAALRSMLEDVAFSREAVPA